MLKKPGANNNRGMALVTCLLIMVVLAMIGIGITTDSSIEIKINGNFKNKAVSFRNSDTGTSAAPGIIEDNLENPPAGHPYTYPSSGASPTVTVNIDTDTFSAIEEGITLHKAITIEIPAVTATGTVNKQATKTFIDVSKTKRLAAGAAMQMAAGYEGIGKGGNFINTYYLCRSTGFSGNNTAVTTSEIYYLHTQKKESRK